MEAFLVATGVVALAEIGDKTQLLAFVLAARFRRPTPIIAGILVATLANHALAGAVGTFLVDAIAPAVLRWILGVSFLAMAAWMLVPDTLEAAAHSSWDSAGAFGSTLVAFFLVEMGDKTQIATIGLAARYDAFLAVVAGTTLGMLIANVPAVIVGERLAAHLPVRLVHRVAAAIFVLLGSLVLAGAGAAVGL